MPPKSFRNTPKVKVIKVNIYSLVSFIRFPLARATHFTDPDRVLVDNTTPKREILISQNFRPTTYFLRDRSIFSGFNATDKHLYVHKCQQVFNVIWNFDVKIIKMRQLFLNL